VESRDFRYTRCVGDTPPLSLLYHPGSSRKKERNQKKKRNEGRNEYKSPKKMLMQAQQFITL